MSAGPAPGLLVERHVALVWRAALAVAGTAELAEEVTGATLAVAVAGGGPAAPDALAADAGARALALLQRERRRGGGAPAPDVAGVEGADAEALTAVARLDDLTRAAVGLALLAGLGPVAVAAALGTSERAAEVRLRAALDALRATLGDGLAAGDALEARLRRAGTALPPPAPSAVARILATAVAAERRGSHADVRALGTRPAGHADWTDLPAAPRRRPLPRGVRRAGLVVAGAALLAGAGVAVLRRDARPHARPRATAHAAPVAPTAAVALAVVTPVAPTAVPLVLHGARPLESFITRDVVALLGRGAPLASATFSGPAGARRVVVAPSRTTPFAAVAAAAATSAIARRLRALGERMAPPASSGAVTDAALLTRRPLAANRVDELAAGIAARARALGLPIRTVTAYPLGIVRIDAQPSDARWFGESRRGWLASLVGDGAPVVVAFELRAPDGTAMAQAVLGPDATAVCACPGAGPVPDAPPPADATGPTRLAIDVVTRALPGAARHVTLDCDAGRATGVADAASICARIDGDRYRLLAPDALGADVCPGAFGTPRVRIRGVYEGIAVERSYGSCAGHEGDLWRAALAGLPPRVTVPAAAGRSLRDAARRVVAAGLAPRFGAIPALRPGPACADLLTAAAQVPAPGAGARRGSVVVLRVGRAARRCPPAGPTAIFGRVDVRVPDLRGLALDAALARVVESGLRVALTPAAAGRGRLVVGAQSPAAATNAHAGSVVTLSLAR